MPAGGLNRLGRDGAAVDRRIDQLDARLIAGGAIDDLVLRETLVAAREHAFSSAMQALEVQTLQLADAVAQADTGVIAYVANHYDIDIHKLPGELRDVAKVQHGYRNEYRHCTAAAQAANDTSDGADPRAQRLAMLVARTEALDSLEPQACAWVATGYLKKRLDFAEAELRDARIRSMVVMLAATVAQVLVGNFAGGGAQPHPGRDGRAQCGRDRSGGERRRTRHRHRPQHRRPEGPSVTRS